MVRSRTIAFVMVFGFLVTGLGAQAHAMRGEIRSPSGVAFSSDYPAASRHEVERALVDSGAEFLRGHFINWVSTLRFRGDANSLNAMVGRLSQCQGTTVSILLDEMDEGCDWVIVHDGMANRFQITINLQSTNILLKELRIPDIHGSKVVR